VNIKGWDLPDGDTTFVEYNSGTSYPVTVSNDIVTLNVNLIRQKPYLFVLKPFIGIEAPGEQLSGSFPLFQNYPNPSNLASNIRYSLTRNCYVELRIYNITGQLVRTLVNGRKRAGIHSVTWDGRDDSGKRVASGVYFCRLKAGNSSQTRKLLLLR